jgi:hypothetical protein
MDPADVYDKAWRQGHRAGYLDAISEIAMGLGDLQGDKLREMLDLIAELHKRYEKVTESYALTAQ